MSQFLITINSFNEGQQIIENKFKKKDRQYDPQGLNSQLKARS